MENIYEKSAVKPRDIKDNLITLFTILGTLAICAGSIIIEFTRNYAFAIIIVACIIAFKLITSRNIEYEYILAGNSISMDKIYNKRRRKRIINCDLTDFDIVAPVASKHFDDYKNNAARTIKAVSGDAPESEYFGLLEYDRKRTILIFEVDERTIAHLKKHIEHSLKS